MTSDIKVITLDLDGVLFDGSSAAFVVAQKVGLAEQYVTLFQRMVEENMNLRQSVIEGSKIWKGITIDESYKGLVDSLPLMSGAVDTVDALRGWGYEVGCISSGVSQFFMKPFMDRLNLDFAYSNILGSINGAHDGTVKYIMGGPEKAETILKHVEENGYTQNNIASVGNGLNDIELFNVSAFSIAFNPVDKIVSDTASVTVKSNDLRSILNHFKKT
ncbi:MAG: HAD family hydrolase [Candidatus Sifarchaeia archaeon]